MNSSDMKFYLLSFPPWVSQLLIKLMNKKKKIASLVENWFTLSFLKIQDSESSKY